MYTHKAKSDSTVTFSNLTDFVVREIRPYCSTDEVLDPERTCSFELIQSLASPHIDTAKIAYVRIIF
jgi:hypothetical protein